MGMECVGSGCGCGEMGVDVRRVWVCRDMWGCGCGCVWGWLCGCGCRCGEVVWGGGCGEISDGIVKGF